MAEKLSVQIYNSVKQQIESGTLGARTFISEAQIAQQYGVSKAPVRDALHLLSRRVELSRYATRPAIANSDGLQPESDHLFYELSVSMAADHNGTTEVEFEVSP